MFSFTFFLVPLKPLKAIRSNQKIIAIVVPCVILAMVICGICGVLWYRQSRRVSETSVTAGNLYKDNHVRVYCFGWKRLYYQITLLSLRFSRDR